jgi:hypothetical protein
MLPIGTVRGEFAAEFFEVPELNEMTDAEGGEAGLIRSKGEASDGIGGGMPETADLFSCLWIKEENSFRAETGREQLSVGA